MVKKSVKKTLVTIFICNFVSENVYMFCYV